MNDLTPTVFLVDDDPSARRGLSRLIRVAGFNIQAFASAEDFLASEHRSGPGCIILDVKMPGLSGPDLQAEMNKAEYRMPIIFISGHGDVPMTAQAMKEGALDFLTKPVDRDHLLNAIRNALDKDRTSRQAYTELQQIRAKLAKLTPREFEVMKFVVAGLLNKQIGYALGIAEDTVKIHRGRMMSKMGVVSVADLVRLTQKAGVEPTDPGSQ
jgi:FixJ family two-component response regulator